MDLEESAPEPAAAPDQAQAQPQSQASETLQVNPLPMSQQISDDASDNESSDSILQHSPFEKKPTPADSGVGEADTGGINVSHDVPEHVSLPRRVLEPVFDQDDSKKEDLSNVKKAQDRVSRMTFNAFVGKIQSIDDLKWLYVDRTKKVYPCRIVHDPDEYKAFHLGGYRGINFVVIQNFGQDYDDALGFTKANAKNLIPMVDDSEENVDGDQVESINFRRYLDLFVKTIRGQKVYSDHPVKLIVEKLAVKAMVQKVREKCSSQAVDQVSQHAFIQPNHAQSSVRVSLSPVNVGAESDSDESDLYDPSLSKSKKTLRCGDEIEFYEGVAGNVHNKREAKIVSIDPTQDLPLVTDPMHFISKDTEVKRVAFIRGGKLVKTKDPIYQQLHEYKLVADGVLVSAKSGKQKSNAQKGVKKNAQQKGDTMIQKGQISNPKKKASESSPYATKKPKAVVKTSSKRKAEPQAMPPHKKARAGSSNEDPAKLGDTMSASDANTTSANKNDTGSDVRGEGLDDLIEIVMEKIRTKHRRYRPHMTVAQLNLAKDVWKIIGDRDYIERIEEIADEHDLSENSVLSFLNGDIKITMRENEILQIEGALKKEFDIAEKKAEIS